MINFFGKDTKKEPNSKFSKFFVDSSASEKKKVFSQAARRANKKQRQLFDDRPVSTAK
jgi:hypothetical protein